MSSCYGSSKYDYMSKSDYLMKWSKKHTSEIVEKIKTSNRFSIVADASSAGDDCIFMARYYRQSLSDDPAHSEWFIWISNDERRRILKVYGKKT